MGKELSGSCLGAADGKLWRAGDPLPPGTHLGWVTATTALGLLHVTMACACTDTDCDVKVQSPSAAMSEAPAAVCVHRCVRYKGKRMGAWAYWVSGRMMRAAAPATIGTQKQTPTRMMRNGK